MRFVDLHCDTIAMKVALSGGRTELYKNDCHIDIEKLQKGGCLAQFFAIFVPINGAAENHGVKLGSYDFFQMAYKVYLEQMEKNKDYILPAMNYEDIMRNKEIGKMSSVLTIEEGHPVEGKMERIKSGTTFKDIAGVDEVKNEVMEVVQFLRNPRKFLDLGANSPSGVLLVGPPGTGGQLPQQVPSPRAPITSLLLSCSNGEVRNASAPTLWAL